jgi:competence ComEA-like helix-hairpin-helix protein
MEQSGGAARRKGVIMKRVISALFVLVLLLGGFWSGYAVEEQMQTVNINTAGAEELMELPGIDNTLAQSIISFRNVNGPFSSVDDLLKVEGMDMEKLDAIRSWLTIQAPEMPMEE